MGLNAKGLVSEGVFTPDELVVRVRKARKLTVVSGAGVLVRGTVLGVITVGAAGAPVNAGTGNGVVSAVALGTKSKVGSYVLKFTGALTYNVLNPSGSMLAPGVAAGAYVDPELGFTFTAGGTAMVAGDTITIPVAAGSGKVKTATAAATDGSSVPDAILAEDVDATSADADAVTYYSGDFNQNHLTLGAGLTLASIEPVLRGKGILLIDTVL